MFESKSAIKKSIVVSVFAHAAVGTLVFLAYKQIHFVTSEKMIPVGVTDSPALEAKALIKQSKESTVNTATDAAPSERSESGATTAEHGSKSEKEIYLSELRSLIESKKTYPSTAKTLGETGTVEVHFWIKKSGEISNVEIAKPCASRKLNQAALELVRKIEKFRAFPEKMLEEKIELVLPVVYKLD